MTLCVCVCHIDLDNLLLGIQYVTPPPAGDAAEWRWFVPHDIPGLVSLFSSEEEFAKQLGEFFQRAQDHPSNLLPNPYYW